MNDTTELLKVINDLINKPGKKVDFKGYLVNEDDISQLDYYLTIENLYFNKQKLEQKTNELIKEINFEYNQIEENSPQKELLLQLKTILDKLKTSEIENLTYYGDIIIPKTDLELFKNLYNQYRFHTTQETNLISMYTENIFEYQRKRIKQHQQQNTTESMITELNDSLESLQKVKDESEPFIDDELKKYKEYLMDEYTNALVTDNLPSLYYYEEMLRRFRIKKCIEDPGYIYYLNNKKGTR